MNCDRCGHKGASPALAPGFFTCGPGQCEGPGLEGPWDPSGFIPKPEGRRFRKFKDWRDLASESHEKMLNSARARVRLFGG
jgi:hypothetical protein